MFNEFTEQDFDLTRIPEPSERPKIQYEYRNVANLFLDYDYSYINKFSHFNLWDASSINQETMVINALEEFKKYPIGSLANNRDKGRGNNKLASYDLRTQSKQISKCFLELLKDLQDEYDCTILHRLVISKEIRVWGILQNNSFIVLFLDKYHMLMPNGNNITKLGINGDYKCNKCSLNKEEYKSQYGSRRARKR